MQNEEVEWMWNRQKKMSGYYFIERKRTETTYDTNVLNQTKIWLFWFPMWFSIWFWTLNYVNDNCELVFFLLLLERFDYAFVREREKKKPFN